jgi:hypothetical protein
VALVDEPAQAVSAQFFPRINEAKDKSNAEISIWDSVAGGGPHRTLKAGKGSALGLEDLCELKARRGRDKRQGSCRHTLINRNGVEARGFVISANHNSKGHRALRIGARVYGALRFSASSWLGARTICGLVISVSSMRRRRWDGTLSALESGTDVLVALARDVDTLCLAIDFLPAAFIVGEFALEDSGGLCERRIGNVSVSIVLCSIHG